VIYLKQKSKKEISYTVLSDVALFNVKNEVKENFEVRFYRAAVSDASFVVVKI